jgi:hypothetical protein
MKHPLKTIIAAAVIVATPSLLKLRSTVGCPARHPFLEAKIVKQV